MQRTCAGSLRRATSGVDALRLRSASSAARSLGAALHARAVRLVAATVVGWRRRLIGRSARPHDDAVDRTAGNAQLATGASALEHGVQLAAGADDRIDRAWRQAAGAADAGCLVDPGDAGISVAAAGRVERQCLAPSSAASAPMTAEPPGATAIDWNLVVGQRLGIRAAAIVAAAHALRLRQQRIDAIHWSPALARSCIGRLIVVAARIPCLLNSGTSTRLISSVVRWVELRSTLRVMPVQISLPPPASTVKIRSGSRRGIRSPRSRARTLCPSSRSSANANRSRPGIARHVVVALAGADEVRRHDAVEAFMAGDRGQLLRGWGPVGKYLV